MKCNVNQCKIRGKHGHPPDHAFDEPKPSILSALTQAVAAHYKAQGDRTLAGVVVACLTFEPPTFYTSVVRYPEGPHSKKVVCSVIKHDTVEGAIEILAAKWYALVKPAPVQDTLENLRAALDGTDGR